MSGLAPMRRAMSTAITQLGRFPWNCCGTMLEAANSLAVRWMRSKPPTVSKPALMEGSRGGVGFFNSESVVVCGCWLMGYRLHLQMLKMGQYFFPHPLDRGLP